MQRVVLWCFSECVRVYVPVRSSLNYMQRESGFALVDILQELHPFLFSMELPAPVLRDLVSKLADIEHNLSVGTHAKLQTAAVVGAFTTARLAMAKAA